MIEVSDDCVQAGVHVADKLIADAPDAAQKATLERDKTKIVRRTAEACTTQKWSADAIKCYITAKSMAELRKCEKKLPLQQQPPRPPQVPKRNPKAPR